MTEKIYNSIGNKLELPDRTKLKKGSGLEGILEILKPIMIDYLNDDISGLINLMYRLDVSEKKFNQALDAGGVDTIAEALSKLILERELKKFESRQTDKDSN